MCGESGLFKMGSDDSNLELHFPEFANLSYRELRDKFSQNYESFMCQQQNDPQGGQQDPIDTREIVIGQYADYFNTGIWSMVDGQIVAPDDLTIEQLKDFLTASGGAVYLRHDRKLCWATTK